VSLLRGAAPNLVLNPLDTSVEARRILREKRTAKALSLHQVLGNVPELCRVVLMDEEDVHEDKKNWCLNAKGSH
jgi:hypothetical protein